MRKYWIHFSILFFCLFVSPTIHAQNVQLDSLRSLLSNSKGEERVDLLVELSFLLREINQAEAMEFAVEAEKLAIEIQDLPGESKAKENISWVYYRTGYWQKAFEYAEDAYQLSLEAGDELGAARVLNNMGALYYEQQNFRMAIRQFKRAYEISKNSDDLYTQIRSLNNVAFNYSQLGVLDSAMFFAQKAIQTNENAGSPYLTSFSNRVIGDVFLARGQLDSAETYFETSLDMARKQGISTTIASVIHRLGNTYIQLGKLNNAQEVLEEGIALSQAHNLRDELAKSHKYLAEVYRKRGDIPSAFDHQSLYLAINDSLVDKSNRDRMALMQGMFEQNLEKSELELLKAQNENQANKLDFIKKVVWIISIAAILIFGLLIWLFRLNRNVEKFNTELVKQQKLIEDQNSALEAKSAELEEINQTKNKLFSILGHDLRGPVGQVKAIVDLATTTHLNQDEFAELLNSMKKDLDTVHFTLTNTLKWSTAQMEGFKVFPTEFNLRDVVDTTISLLSTQIKAKNIEVLVHMPEKLPVYLDRDIMEVVVRNILNNAIKYSQNGKSIEVNVQEIDGVLNWCVKDEGTGMTPEQVKEILSSKISLTNSKLGTNREKGSGLGLQVCKEFIRMCDGELLIESEPGKGSRFCVSIPDKLPKNLLDPVNS